MPAWLRAIADWNPVSALAAAMRDLFGNPTAPANGAWPLLHPVFASVCWLVLLLLIFVPLCAARYARALGRARLARSSCAIRPARAGPTAHGEAAELFPRRWGRR
jgi:hypothetical protein